MALVASPSHSWAQSLPYHRPSAAWNTAYYSPSASSASSSSSSARLYTQTASQQKEKPRLRLLAIEVSSPSSSPSTSAHSTSKTRFDPFADEPVASTSQLPPPPAAQNTTAAPPPTRGRRRAPSFSAGPNTPRSACSSPTPSPSTSKWSSSASSATWVPSPAPSLSRPALSSASSTSTSRSGGNTPLVPLAPTPFHARHYPTPDARARLLARTLLNRIHAVGRPRSLYSCSSSTYSRTRGGCVKMEDGYESECGSRGYVPSRLSECVVAC
ncbi:hypothetical protein C8R43DRAFT_1027496 [Mycena crocata]|nr:hypothetical protein C8R43DRAFT_1027496 [Mycena crocata]